MKLLTLLLLPISLVLLNCDKKADLKTPKGRWSYAIGSQIGKNIKSQNIELDADSFYVALQTEIKGGKPQLTEDEIREALQKMAEKRNEAKKGESDENKKKADAYLAENGKKPGIKTTASGLQYEVITEGNGKKPKDTDTVKVHYAGTFIDGKEFDSSYKRNQPAEFPVKGVIPGWTEALQLMTVGSKYKLYVPPNLAYGENGNPSIPGNSVLIFQVELIEIVKK